ncbi:hypothetical protein IT402_02525 [Candidatus Nomurabacteria bacterium]|nr:hypothetical protein [Candidatus Nomurabacteria bacterium]
MLKHCFGKKRKQILGSLADYLESKDKAVSILQKADISEKARPETLSKEDWANITRYIEE